MIRLFKDSDYKEICQWWQAAGEPVPPRNLIAPKTYILENSVGIPWICLSLIEFSTPHIAWSAGLVSNPSLTKEGRKAAVKELWDYVAATAKELGYANLLCIAPNERLEKRYAELGFIPTYRNQTFMVKPL